MRDKSINIMYVVDKLGAGGAEKVVFSLIQEIDKTIFSPFLCCLRDYGILGKKLKESHFRVFSLESKRGKDPLLILKMAKIFRELKIDIIHAHNSTACLYSIFAAKIAGSPQLIQTKHGDELFREGRLKKSFNKLLTPCVAKRVYVSKKMYQGERVKVNSFFYRSVYIPNGISINEPNPDISRADFRLQMGFKNDDRVVLNVGNIRPEKDQEILVKAIAIVKERIPKIKLLIAGDKVNVNLTKRIEKSVVELGLSDNVFLLGFRKDIPKLLLCSDAFVLSSVTEAMPMSILEAMAAKVPVIATDVGDNSELVINHKTGVLVPSKDYLALSKSIIFILENSSKANEFAEEALSLVNKKFSLKKMVENHEKLYLSVLEK